MKTASIRFMPTSVQEELAEIRPVDRRVTPYTFAHRGKAQAAMRNIRRLGIHVTLQAEEATFAPHKQHPCNCSVRTVAGDAAFDLHCRMFENEWPALFGMTVDAAFPVRSAKHRLIAGSMRTVAVRTLHQPFRYAVVTRQCELRLDHAMACETQFGLRSPKQIAAQPSGLLVGSGNVKKQFPRAYNLDRPRVIRSFHQVRRMAGVAGDTIEMVLRPIELRLVLAGDVT
jgi:hypothetical protein